MFTVPPSCAHAHECFPSERFIGLCGPLWLRQCIYNNPSSRVSNGGGGGGTMGAIPAPAVNFHAVVDGDVKASI